jgi:hypothetical protein
MDKPQIEREMALEYGMTDLFDNLGNALKKGELVLNMRSSYEADHFIFDHKSGRVTRTVRMYDFDNGVVIAQERYDENGAESFRERGWPACEWASKPYHEGSTFYFVYVGNRPVTDRKEAKDIIHQTTGVKLPRLTMPNFEYSVVQGRNHEVVTNFKDVGKKPSESDFSYEDEQPSEEDIAIDLKDQIIEMDSPRGKALFADITDDLKALRAAAFEFYQKYKSKLPENVTPL